MALCEVGAFNDLFIDWPFADNWRRGESRATAAWLCTLQGERGGCAAAGDSGAAASTRGVGGAPFR